MNLRRLKPTDAEAYRTLRLLGLRESPSAFGRAYREEVVRPVAFFAERLKSSDHAWTFGAWEERELVGIVTLLRGTGVKERHKAMIVGMVVHPDHRRRGIARKLLTRTLLTASRQAGLRQLRIAVVEGNAAALALYQSFGFTLFGREPEALLHRRRYLDELFLARPARLADRV